MGKMGNSLEQNGGVFSGDKFIHNSLLNFFGLHVFRIILAHIFYNIRTILISSKLSEEQKILRKDGIIIIKNFLPNEKFEGLKNEFKNSRDFDGSDVKIPDGDSLWIRRKFSQKQITNLHNTKEFLINSRLLDLVSSAEARKVSFNSIWFDEVSHVDNKKMDSQKVLHSDIFYHNHKVFYFISDVKEEDGPLNVAIGSHRFSLKRLWFEYKKSISDEKGVEKKDKGSFRVDEKEKSFLGLKIVKAIVPANSLVIVNTCAFHSRGISSIGSKRLAMFLQFRHNPFSLKRD